MVVVVWYGGGGGRRRGVSTAALQALIKASCFSPMNDNDTSGSLLYVASTYILNFHLNVHPQFLVVGLRGRITRVCVGGLAFADDGAVCCICNILPFLIDMLAAGTRSMASGVEKEKEGQN